MENESIYSDGSGRQSEEDDAAVAARHRAQQVETRRQAYMRVASPLVSGGGRAHRATDQSLDLEGFIHDDRGQQPGDVRYGGESDSGYPGSRRLERQVTLPAAMGAQLEPLAEFRGFSRDGRQPGKSAPSPVPFRGMTPGGGRSFSTPRTAVAASQSGSIQRRGVAFHPPPVARNSESLVGARGTSSVTVVPSRGGSSILDRAAYLTASRSTILSKALSAGRQQQELARS